LYEAYKEGSSDEIKKAAVASNEFDSFYPFVQQIFEAYGHLDGDDLEIISHGEEPWKEARGDKRPWEACDTIISEDTMKSFYRKKNSYAQV
jgi:uncharacterized phage-associated protein